MTEVRSISGSVPKGALVAPRVNFELQRKEGQPCPSDFLVSSKHTHSVGKRTRPNEIPQSRMTIPKTRGLSVDVLWEQQCMVLPQNQKYGLAWVFFLPLEPGIKFESIKVVFISSYKTRHTALSAQVRAKGMFPNRTSMLFKIGYWQALPVPRWLDEFEDVDQYNGEVIKRHMTYDFKLTEIEHELLRRRVKAKVEQLPDDPAVASEKIEEAIYGKDLTLEENGAEGGADETKDPGVVVSATTRAVDQWDANPVKGLLSPKSKIGLAWVLPTLQRRGRKLTDVAIAWLGTFRSVQAANAQQKLIKKAHPEWHVYSFEVGQPLSLPVPTWEMQREKRVQYDQNILKDLMGTDPEVGGAPGVDILPPATMRQDPANDDSSLFDDIVGAPEDNEKDDENEDLVSTKKGETELGHGLKLKFEMFRPRTKEDDIQLPLPRPPPPPPLPPNKEVEADAKLFQTMLAEVEAPNNTDPKTRSDHTAQK